MAQSRKNHGGHHFFCSAFSMMISFFFFCRCVTVEHPHKHGTLKSLNHFPCDWHSSFKTVTVDDLHPIKMRNQVIPYNLYLLSVTCMWNKCCAGTSFVPWRTTVFQQQFLETLHHSCHSEHQCLVTCSLSKKNLDAAVYFVLILHPAGKIKACIHSFLEKNIAPI